MERINPLSFSGPRAYITDFDYRAVRFIEDVNFHTREVERRLKIILLTKNVVVCAASHLSHEFAFNFLKKNPILLEKNMIIPALRTDKQDVTDYLYDSEFDNSLKESMRNFYLDRSNKVVYWELMENTTWFRTNLLNSLKNEHSVIRRALLNLPATKWDSLISKIETNKILSRGIILEGISKWPLNEQKIILDFINLVYHMSGARVVNCESALPSEIYIDYSLTDFSKQRTILSETQVFLKIFFELAFETLHRNVLPVELLDVLSFEDIYYIRKPIEESSFRKKYDKLIQKSTQIIREPQLELDSLIDDIEEPLDDLEQINETFDEVFRQELPEFQKKKHLEKARELQKSTLSLGIGIAELFPPISSIATAYNLVSSSCDFFVNLSQYFRDKSEINDYGLYLKNKEKLLRQTIEKYSISEKSTFLDTLDLLINAISIKIKL